MENFLKENKLVIGNWQKQIFISNICRYVNLYLRVMYIVKSQWGAQSLAAVFVLVFKLHVTDGFCIGVISRQMYSRLQMGCSDWAQILHTYFLWQNMSFWQVSALNMRYGGFREISKFWQFFAIFLHEFFKNHVKHQKITQKNIQTYIIDVKFPAEYDPAIRKS